MGNRVNDFYDYMEYSTSQIKALSPEANLKVLDQMANNSIGAILSTIYKSSVYKILPAINGTYKNNRFHDYSYYGHLSCGNRMFRLSTCLDKRNNIFELPQQELGCIEDNTRIFATTGDLFIIIKANKLKAREAPTDVGNFMYSLKLLFDIGAIEHFGLFKDGCLKLDGTKTITKLKEPCERFKKIKLRGCMTSKSKKYALVRITSVATEDDVKVDFFSSANALKNCTVNIGNTEQYITKCARDNTGRFLDFEFNKCRKPLELVDKVTRHHYIVLRDVPFDIKAIYAYIAKLREAYSW